RRVRRESLRRHQSDHSLRSGARRFPRRRGSRCGALLHSGGSRRGRMGRAAIRSVLRPRRLEIRSVPRSGLLRQLPQSRRHPPALRPLGRALALGFGLLPVHRQRRQDGPRRDQSTLATGSRAEPAGLLPGLEPESGLPARGRRRLGARRPGLRPRQQARAHRLAERYAGHRGPGPLAPESGNEPVDFEARGKQRAQGRRAGQALSHPRVLLLRRHRSGPERSRVGGLQSQPRPVRYYAGYVQDNLRWQNLTVNAGLRYDHNNLFETEKLLQPRLGLAYYIPATKTVIRAAYDRLFITPEYENILLSSSAAAAALVPPQLQGNSQLGRGHLFNVSERHDSYNFGLQQGIGSALRLDLSYWKRKVVNAADQDQFFNTGIVFPLNFKGGELNGWNARLDGGPWNGVRGYLSIGHVHALYENPFVGGLFLDAGAL